MTVAIRRAVSRSTHYFMLGTISFALLARPCANGDLIPGVLSDFEDGTLQGWITLKNNTSNVAGGPIGSTRYLEVSPAPRLSARTTSVAGVINSSVTSINVDMLRPSNESDLEMRLVLFGPETDNRWTSTNASVLQGNGAWQDFSFSIDEADLTQVQGTGTYSDLIGGLNRIMFRYQAGAPDANGTPGASGTFGLDNVEVVPEPGTWIITAMGITMLGLVRRRWTRLA